MRILDTRNLIALVRCVLFPNTTLYMFNIMSSRERLEDTLSKLRLHDMCKINDSYSNFNLIEFKNGSHLFVQKKEDDSQKCRGTIMAFSTTNRNLTLYIDDLIEPILNEKYTKAIDYQQEKDDDAEDKDNV